MTDVVNVRAIPGLCAAPPLEKGGAYAGCAATRCRRS